MLTENKWRLLAKALRFLGFAGCIAILVLLSSLVAYYSATRPHVPQPALGWTVRLYWSITPPSYGTAHENACLLLLFRLFIPFFAIIAFAEAIRIYKLKE